MIKRCEMAFRKVRKCPRLRLSYMRLRREHEQMLGTAGSQVPYRSLREMRGGTGGAEVP
jgi:hypothetical protein